MSNRGTTKCSVVLLFNVTYMLCCNVVPTGCLPISVSRNCPNFLGTNYPWAEVIYVTLPSSSRWLLQGGHHLT